MSNPFIAVSAALDFVRARLLGGMPVLSMELLAPCLRRVLCEGESASSSPEASREDGCSMSALEDLASSEVAVRLRFPEPLEEGEDMVPGRGRSRSSLMFRQCDDLR